MKKADDKEGMEWQNEADAELNSSNGLVLLFRIFFIWARKNSTLFTMSAS